MRVTVSLALDCSRRVAGRRALTDDPGERQVTTISSGQGDADAGRSRIGVGPHAGVPAWLEDVLRQRPLEGPGRVEGRGSNFQK